MKWVGWISVAWLGAALVAVGCGDDETVPMTDGGPPASCFDGMLSVGETDVDCGGPQCEACGLDLACEVDSDCRSARCVGDTCRAPESCFDFELTEGETDLDCGGPNCPGCLLGKACVEDVDCRSGNCSDELVCIATCDDGVVNGDETDVDCGGSCDGCGTGGTCQGDADCADKICESNACVAGTCTDGIANAAETDVDCGGGTCPACEGGDACSVASDCTTGACIDSVCASSTCANGIKDTGETDVDCGGDTCGGCLPGKICTDTDDCDGSICEGGTCRTAETCLGLLALDPTFGSGAYVIEPSPGEYAKVWCDMETDGGGWTLVGSSRNDPLNDFASRYYDDLATLDPAGENAGVWDGLRDAMPVTTTDVRFACKRNPRSEELSVDLAFYSTDFYYRVTKSTRDSETCFFPNNGSGFDRPAPARRNLLANEFLPIQNNWTAGFLEGEDSCADPNDFTIDFDDRGMDGNASDGTDWGEANGTKKCGTSGLGTGAWFIFVREANPACENGVLDGEEINLDCGGACPGCGVGLSCTIPGDCIGFSCTGGFCADTCSDGVLQPFEAGIDCGGICSAKCARQSFCREDADCTAGDACIADQCQPAHCGNGVKDGDESDVNCGGSCFKCELNDTCTRGGDCESGYCPAVETGPRVCSLGTTCKELYEADDTLRSGTYELRLEEDGPRLPVFCDMETDGGGWTLVAARSGTTIHMDDQSSGYYSGLSTLNSGYASSVNNVWDGLRGIITDTSDIRFACLSTYANASTTIANFTVDLSFYDVDWYRQITASTSECSNNFVSPTYAWTTPERRNNKTGEVKGTDDAYNDSGGRMIGEDSACDASDFSVDFDDRGSDGNQSDGTDWGEDDGVRKCGTGASSVNGSWYIFVREPDEAPPPPT